MFTAQWLLDWILFVTVDLLVALFHITGCKTIFCWVDYDLYQSSDHGQLYLVQRFLKQGAQSYCSGQVRFSFISPTLTSLRGTHLKAGTFHTHLFLFSSPLMTSCLLISFLLRVARASGEASSLQLAGSCSNSRRRGSTSSSCGDGLVGEWAGPSTTRSGPSTLKMKGK